MQTRVGMIADIKGLARVHYESWKTTYTGIFSDQVIANRTYEEVEANWRPRLEKKADKYQCFLAETGEGEIVAFAECGVERTNNYQVDGELYTLYILEEYQKKGIGTELFKMAIGHLLEHEIRSMMTWVIKNNGSRIFYERHEGEVIAEQAVGDTGIMEVAFAWRDIAKTV
jgi:GNAT superfamily N-acetyltransferase